MIPMIVKKSVFHKKPNQIIPFFQLHSSEDKETYVPEWAKGSIRYCGIFHDQDLSLNLKY